MGDLVQEARNLSGILEYMERTNARQFNPAHVVTCIALVRDRLAKSGDSHADLVKALEFIRDGYANQDVNHVDYRVKVYQVALDALAKVRP